MICEIHLYNLSSVVYLDIALLNTMFNGSYDLMGKAKYAHKGYNLGVQVSNESNILCSQCDSHLSNCYSSSEVCKIVYKMKKLEMVAKLKNYRTLNIVPICRK